MSDEQNVSRLSHEYCHGPLRIAVFADHYSLITDYCIFGKAGE